MSQMLWNVVAVAGAAGMVICLYFMYGTKHGIPGLTALDKSFKSLDMRARYGAAEVYACFDGVGKKGQAMLLNFWKLDFAFIAGFLLVMLAISHNTARILPVRYIMYGAAMLRAALDMVENVLLMRVCGAYPQKRLDCLANASGTVTLCKWVALGIWVVCLFVGLFAAAFGLI